MRGIKGVVLGHNMKTAILQLNSIVERYETFQYAKVIEQRQTKHYVEIVFDNADKWVAMKGTSENCHGRRYNIAYIDRALPENVVNYIRYCLTAPPYTGIQYYGIPITE